MLLMLCDQFVSGCNIDTDRKVNFAKSYIIESNNLYKDYQKVIKSLQYENYEFTNIDNIFQE